MATAEYVKGEVCGIDNCREKWFYIENGKWYCRRNGHEKQGITQTQTDEDDFGTQGRKTRQKREAQEKVYRIYSGRRAFELYLQCYQLILWKQCHSLVHTKNFVPELESVVRDLWALHLQLLKGKTEDATDTENESPMFSSQAGLEEGTGPGEGAGSVKGAMKGLGKSVPTLVDTLGLCYLGMLLLRLPVCVGDVHGWATREEIPFVRAVRLVPSVMKNKLPAHFLGALDTRSPLTPDDLHTAVHRLVLLYNQRFDLVVPPLNYPLILFTYVRKLALPLEIYAVVRTLASLLAFDFTFPPPAFRQRMSSLPEICLVSLLVIAVKLYHPFDSLPRYAKNLTELGMLTVDWDVWIQAQKDHSCHPTTEGSLGRGNEIAVTEDDVFSMSGKQLDDYLDWYEKTWVEEERASHALPQQLLDMFPTGRLDGPTPLTNENRNEISEAETAISQKLHAVQNSLKMRGIVSTETEAGTERPIRRIGSLYKHYRSEEDLPPAGRAFYEAVARLAGVTVATLVEVVFQTERKLHSWRQQQVKREWAEDSIQVPQELAGEVVVSEGVSGEANDEDDDDDLEGT